MGLTLILRTVAIDFFGSVLCACVCGGLGLACGGVCGCVKVCVHAQLLSISMQIFFV